MSATGRAGQPPAESVRELQELIGKVRYFESGLANCEGAERWGCADARASQEAEVADLTRGLGDAKAALAAFLAAIRIESPAETAPWAAALAAVGGQAGMDLVEALLDCPGIDAAITLPALEQLLADAQDTMRVAAWEAIIKVFGLGPRLQNPEGHRDNSTEVELWLACLWRGLPAFVKIGVDGMRQVVRQLQAGATPEASGIKWMPNPAPELFDRLGVATVEPEAAFPVEEIAQLTGVNRRWAEAMIAFRLEAGDLRVPAALARLGAKWTVPSLAEVAGSAETSPELREQITPSLRVLDR